MLGRERGWTNWTHPSVGGGRSTFLKEAVNRVYEERVCDVSSPSEADSITASELRVQRRANLAAEIADRRLMITSIHSERPMSRWQSVMRRLDTPPIPQLPPPPVPQVASPVSPQTQLVPSTCPILKPPPVPPTYSPLSPPTSGIHSISGFIDSHYGKVLSPANPAPPATGPELPIHPALSPPDAASIHPAFRNGTDRLPPRHSASSSAFSFGTDAPPPYENSRSQATMQHPLQWAMAAPEPLGCTNSADKAIFRIVEMGFSPEQAKGALKITDMGDGLRVDRAVEYLIRQMERGY